MAEDRGRYGNAEGSAARSRDGAWAAEGGGGRVRALRAHLAETQSEFAERLGTNQQTISEWERGLRRPRRMARRLLQMVAEEAAFYGEPGDEHLAEEQR